MFMVKPYERRANGFELRFMNEGKKIVRPRASALYTASVLNKSNSPPIFG